MPKRTCFLPQALVLVSYYWTLVFGPCQSSAGEQNSPTCKSDKQLPDNWRSLNLLFSFNTFLLLFFAVARIFVENRRNLLIFKWTFKWGPRKFPILRHFKVFPLTRWSSSSTDIVKVDFFCSHFREILFDFGDLLWLDFGLLKHQLRIYSC